MIRTRIAVTGLAQQEMGEGIPHILEELNQRPWLLAKSARWDDERKALMVEVLAGGRDAAVIGEVAMDEVWDIVIGTVDWQFEEIQFELIDSSAIERERE